MYPPRVHHVWWQLLLTDEGTDCCLQHANKPASDTLFWVDASSRLEVIALIWSRSSAAVRIVFFVFAHLSSFCALFFPVSIRYTAIYSPPANLFMVSRVCHSQNVHRNNGQTISPPTSYSWNSPQARFTSHPFSWNDIKSNARISLEAVCAVNGAAAHWHDSYGSFLNDTMYNVYSFCQQK